jgi:tetratricopeptide (TPR) repeat protein
LEGAGQLRTGRPRKALETLAAVPPEGRLREPLYLLTGEALYRTGRLAEAEQVFLRLDKLRPDDPQAVRWLAAIYYDLGAMHDAIARLEQLSRLTPDDFAPHRLLAVIHADFERYPEAIRDYREALRRNPPSGVREEMFKGLARSMIRERQYAEALDLLKDAAPDAEALALRAECRWTLGERDEARRTLDRALAGDPDLRAALLLQARIASDEGKPAAAVPPLTRILEKDPHDMEARYQLALADRALGRDEDFRREMARREESLKLRERLTELNLRAMDEPRNAALRDEIADVCDRLGKGDLAVMWRKAAADCRRYGELTGPRPRAGS